MITIKRNTKIPMISACLVPMLFALLAFNGHLRA